jgi:hypothetical protein
VSFYNSHKCPGGPQENDMVLCEEAFHTVHENRSFQPIPGLCWKSLLKKVTAPPWVGM